MSRPPSRSYEQMIERLREAEVLYSALFELTYRCNLDCYFCYNDLSRTGREMESADWRRVLDELLELGVLEVGLSGGEPLVYPGFFDVARHASEIGMVVRVKTNGHLLDAARVERLAREVKPFLLEISLHGAKARSHERQTRVAGSFERLLENVERARDSGLRIQLKTALTRWNEDEIAEIIALARRLELPIAFDAVITPRDDGDTSPLQVAPSDEGRRALLAELARCAEESAGESTAPRKPPMRKPPMRKPGPGNPAPAESTGRNCGTGSTTLTIDPFGQVFPCVQWRRPLGNVHEQSVAEIWHESPALAEVRRLNRRAGRLYAKDAGFCLGLAEQLGGDPLAAYSHHTVLQAIGDPEIDEPTRPTEMPPIDEPDSDEPEIDEPATDEPEIDEPTIDPPRPRLPIFGQDLGL